MTSSLNLSRYKTRFLALIMTSATAIAAFAIIWPDTRAQAESGCCVNGTVIPVGACTTEFGGSGAVCIEASPNEDPCGGSDGGTFKAVVACPTK